MSDATLRESLTALLKAKGWSAAHLARLSDVPRSTLHEWTAGRSAVNLEALRRVAEALGVSVHRLAFGVEDALAEGARASEGEGPRVFVIESGVRIVIERV